MKGIVITLTVDGVDTVLEADYSVGLTVAGEDRSLSLIAVDERPDMPNDPTVCVYVSSPNDDQSDDPRIIAHPLGTVPSGKTNAGGQPVWWEYDL